MKNPTLVRYYNFNFFRKGEKMACHQGSRRLSRKKLKFPQNGYYSSLKEGNLEHCLRFLPSSLTIWCRLMSALLIEVPSVMATSSELPLSHCRARNWPVLKLNLSPSQMVTPIITTQPNRLSCWAPFVLSKAITSIH